MGLYKIELNSSLSVDLLNDYSNNGWSVVDGNAVHDGINSGRLYNSSFKTEPGVEYQVSFDVSFLTGSFILSVGGIETVITDSGAKSITVTSYDDRGISMWSENRVVISPITLYKGETQYTTILFNTKVGIDSYISFTSDNMVSLLGNFFSFKDGQLWSHHSNEKRSTFYDETSPSIIKFAFNSEPRVIKNLLNMKINGNNPWDVDVFVQPREGKPKGQKSRIKQNRFENLQGDYHASFLKDMSDPRFTDEIQALFEGADLQGKIAIITMEVLTDKEIRLINVDFVYNNSNYTY